MSAETQPTAITAFTQTTTPLEVDAADSRWTTALTVEAITSDGVAHHGFLYFGASAGGAYFVQAIREHLGTEGPRYTLAGTTAIHLVQGLWGGLLVAANDKVYRLPPDGSPPAYQFLYTANAKVLWMAGYGANQLLVATATRIVLLSQTGAVQATVATATAIKIAPVVVGAWVCFGDGTKLRFVRILPNNSVQEATPITLGGEATALSAHAEAIYIGGVASGVAYVRGYAPNDQRKLWEMSPAPASKPTTDFAFFGSDLYFCSGSNLYCVDHVGKQKSVQSVAKSEGPLRLVDSVLYGFDDKLFVHDPLQDGVVINVELHGSPRWLGSDGETVYMADHRTVNNVVVVYAYARCFKTVTRSFDVDIQLISDFDVQRQDNTATPYANYRVSMTLHDTNMCVRADEQLSVQTLEETEIIVNDRTVQTGPDRLAVVRTDGFGRLQIQVTADQLCTPTLAFWAHFMEPDERVLVFPDHGVHQQMATLSADSLSQAKAFDGQPILLPGYQDSSSTANLSAGIRNTMSMSRDSRTRTARNAAYLSPRSAEAGTFVVAVEGGRDTHALPANLPIAAPLVTELTWVLMIHPNGGTTYWEREEALASDFAVRGRAMEATSGRRAWSVWSELKSGVARVINLNITPSDVVNAACAVVEMAIGAAREIVKLVVETVEHAAILAQSIFRAVTRGLDKVVESFCALFPWTEIRATNNLLKEVINSGLDAMAATSRQVVSQLKGELHTKVDDAKAHLASVMDGLRADLGQSAMNAPSYAGTHDPEHPTPQSQVRDVRGSWMIDKVMGLLRAMPALPSPFSATLGEKLEATVAALGDTLMKGLSAAVGSGIAGLGALTPSQLISGSAAAFLTLLQGVIDAILDGLVAVADGLLDLLILAVDEAKRLFNSEIHIPGLGALLGAAPTWGDLATLPIAVPLTLIEAALSLPVPGTARMSPEQAKKIRLVSAGVGMGGLLWGLIAACRVLVEAAGGEDPLTRPLMLAFLALNTVVDIAVCGLTIGDVLLGADPVNAETDRWLGLWNLASAILGGVAGFQLHQGAQGDVQRTMTTMLGVIGIIAVAISVGRSPQTIAQQRGRIFVFGLSPTLRFLESMTIFKPWGLVGYGVLAFGGHLAAIIVILLDPAWFPRTVSRVGAEALASTSPVALLHGPGAAPTVTFGAELKPKVKFDDWLEYAVTHVDNGAETPRGPWSARHKTDEVRAVHLSNIPTDPTGLAQARRIYRKTFDHGVRLVGQLDDNLSTTFDDDLTKA